MLNKFGHMRWNVQNSWSMKLGVEGFVGGRPSGVAVVLYLSVFPSQTVIPTAANKIEFPVAQTVPLWDLPHVLDRLQVIHLDKNN